MRTLVLFSYLKLALIFGGWLTNIIPFSPYWVQAAGASMIVIGFSLWLWSKLKFEGSYWKLAAVQIPMGLILFWSSVIIDGYAF
jgi:hypothetical protein